MTKVLVTGANGFIGRRTVSDAGKAGYSITALVRNARLNNGCSVVQHDLRLPLENLPSVDWIFHLAGVYAGSGYEELLGADCRMADNIIASGLKAGVTNWVIASAAEVYGDVEGIATEEAPTRPIIPYGAIKLAVEHRFIERLKNIAGCRVVILRIGEVYGSEGRLILELTRRLRRGFCPWPGSGRVPLSFVHVSDVAQTFLCAVQRAGFGISIYNVADDLPANWRDFVGCVALAIKARPPLFLPAPLVYGYAACSTAACHLAHRSPVLTRHAFRLLMTPKVLSNLRARQDLGYRPHYASYLEGMEEALSGLSHHTKDG
jgi:nucleoside-diphosphate-sugar epimerase